MLISIQADAFLSAIRSLAFLYSINIVITGFNTDIEFEGVTYHVQTEDKGLSNAIIMSLVYDRGTILASKRVSYDDLLGIELDEEILAERLQKQHRLICAAVQAGRIEDLKQMTAREAGVVKAQKPKQRKARAAVSSANVTVLTLSPESVRNSRSFNEPIPKPPFDEVIERPASSAHPSMIEGVSIVGEEMLLPDEAVEIVSDVAVAERPVNNKLSVDILGETKFMGGERRTVSFMVCRGTQRKVVGEAQIMVKIIGSSFRPLIFHASTDNNGLAKVNLQLPNFSSGRAAFLVRAMSDGEEIELRRAISHG